MGRGGGGERVQRGLGWGSKKLAGDQCATGGVRGQPGRACCQARGGREPCEHASTETDDTRGAQWGRMPSPWVGRLWRLRAVAGRPGEERRGAEEGWLWVEVCTQGGASRSRTNWAEGG